MHLDYSKLLDQSKNIKFNYFLINLLDYKFFKQYIIYNNTKNVKYLEI